MDRMMKQMGISNEEIPDVEEVIVRTKTKDYVIRPADVSVMTAQGTKTWQVTGDATERARAGAPNASASASPSAAPTPAAAKAAEPAHAEEDVRLVMEQAHVPREKAIAALKAHGGEPAAAIVALLDEA